MEENIDFIKRKVVLFKLTNCCWVAPIRVGLLAIGYFNFILSIISLVGSANDSFSPTIKKVQDVLLEDNASLTVSLLAYAVEEASNVVLLAAVYRNDRVLLRAYFMYELGVTLAGFVIYSTVLAALDILMKMTVIAGTLFQCYILLLVRSAIVEIKEKECATATNGDIILKDVTIIPKEQTLPIQKQPTPEFKEEKSPPVEKKIEIEPEIKGHKVQPTPVFKEKSPPVEKKIEIEPELQGHKVQPTPVFKEERSPPVVKIIEIEPEIEGHKAPPTEPIEEVKESGKLEVDNKKEKLKAIPEENFETPKRKLNIFKKTTTYKKKNEPTKTKNINENKTDQPSKKTDESSNIKNGETSTKC